MRYGDYSGVRASASLLQKKASAVMATVTSQHEPLGIVVQDGGAAHAAPRIMMWFWASEEDVPERERE